MEKDYFNDGEFSEFQIILHDEFEKAQKLDANECVLKTIKLINEFAKQLNDDDCFEYTERIKKWINRGGI